MLHKKWRDESIISFDLETTGKYPLQAEICEVAAVRWQGGEIVAEFQSLVRPTMPMSEEVIKIHRITNEMVASAPPIAEVISRFHEFCADSLLVAHHAPFDMGFLAVEFETAGLPLFNRAALCSSLISRKCLPESPNHRLQTLIKYLELEAGQAHRALDDARACLHVTLKCLEIIGRDATVYQILEYQKTKLEWVRFSIQKLREREVFAKVVRALEDKMHIKMVYRAGSRPGQPREVFPVGLVRNPDGDFLVALEPGSSQTKRYFLQEIADVQILA